MAGSYVRSVYHCIWSTKRRQSLLKRDRQDRVWSYLAGISQERQMDPLAINGRSDHVHLLLSLPSDVCLSKAVQLIKGGSSKWISEQVQGIPSFRWQKGYAAFSVSRSREEQVKQYIQNQDVHHQSTTFREEYRTFLDQHGIDYEDQYVFE